MKKYYLHNGTEQIGPLDLEELKANSITPLTMIWFEGVENWQEANTIEELKPLFKSIPPPIPSGNFATSNTSTSTYEKEVEDKPLTNEKSEIVPKKINRTVIFVSIGVAALITIGGFIYSSQQQKQEKLEQKESEIEQQLEQQNTKIKEQEDIETKRKTEEQNQQNEAARLQRAAELQSLKSQYDDAITSLRFANAKLEDIKQFQFLRSASEKESQIEKQLEVIRSCENEVDRLKGKISKY